MEPNSFTTEPQYQRPDQRNSEIDYIKRPIPIIIPQPTPVTAPVPAPVPVITPINKFAYDGSFGQRFINKFGREILTWRQLDYYANAIPLGSFCYAIAFIIYGFYRAKVYRVNDTFLWSVILLFGGIGQCTAGFLEYCKGRSFPSTLYLSYGFYCLSHYALYIIPQWFNINHNTGMLYNFSENSLCAFYSAWVVIAFGILVASSRINNLFILQCLGAFIFLLLRAVGEGRGSLGMKRNAAGIFQAISGFFSLFVCFSQLLNNETFYRPVFPTCPMSPDNQIDIINPLAVVATPATVPVV